MKSKEWSRTGVPHPLGACWSHGHGLLGNVRLRHVLGLVHTPGQWQCCVSLELGAECCGAAPAVDGLGLVPLLPGWPRWPSTAGNAGSAHLTVRALIHCGHWLGFNGASSRSGSYHGELRRS